MWSEVWLCVTLVVVVVCTADWPTVTVPDGLLQGTYLQSRGGRRFMAFQGVPYAAPPLASLRFVPPQPVQPWTGPRNAYLPGSECIQPNFLSPNKIVGSEDCLYLNVYTHHLAADVKAPVMVWIHGGAFYFGAGHHYPPDYMMDKDIVLVTINYRLGALGYLSMEDKQLPGNFGMKDQVAALQWVRGNIARFGGDANSVTIFGESAGAHSVHLLMLSPLGRGLFHRAITQSGCGYCPSASSGPGQLRDVSQRFADLLGCEQTNIPDMIKCLLQVPAEDTVKVMGKLYEWHNDPMPLFPPAVEPEDTEDAFLTADPWSMWSSNIPWINGFTSGEGAYKVVLYNKDTIEELNTDFNNIIPNTLCFKWTAQHPNLIAQTIKQFYFPDGKIKADKSFQALTNMYSDGRFIYPALEATGRHQGPKYLYYFDYRGANSGAPNHNVVTHADDLQYFFPMNHYSFKYNVTEENTRMSEKLIELWVNFATQGTPTLDTSEVHWTEAGPDASYLFIKKDGFTMASNLLRERVDFWRHLPFRNKYTPDFLNEEIKKIEL